MAAFIGFLRCFLVAYSHTPVYLIAEFFYQWEWILYNSAACGIPLFWVTLLDSLNGTNTKKRNGRVLAILVGVEIICAGIVLPLATINSTPYTRMQIARSSKFFLECD